MVDHIKEAQDIIAHPPRSLPFIILLGTCLAASFPGASGKFLLIFPILLGASPARTLQPEKTWIATFPYLFLEASLRLAPKTSYVTCVLGFQSSACEEVRPSLSFDDLRMGEAKGTYGTNGEQAQM